MGTMDSVTKEYMGTNEVFADVINFSVYKGNTVVKADNLSELDTSLGAVFSEKINGGNHNRHKKRRRKSVQAYRDIVRKAVIKSDGKCTYVIFGIENQTNIDYTMPVRTMLYDALQYHKQVSDIAAGNRLNNIGEIAKSSGEYLSGFYKTDRIMPVVTVVVYFGADKWNGPISLYDMFGIQDDDTMEYVQNYKVHLIEPGSLTEEELDRFKTGFGYVMSCIKYSGDKEKLTEYISREDDIKLDEAAARVIETVTGITIDVEEKTDMKRVCKAVQDMMDDSREEGREEERMIIFTKLINAGIMSVEAAAEMAGMEKETFIEKSEVIAANSGCRQH